MKIPSVYPNRVLQVSVGLCVFIVIFGFCANTGIFNLIVKKSLTLKPGRTLRDMYLKLPMPLDFRVYFFNVTNPDEVHKGATPILTEIGPFCYDLYKERVNVIDDDEADTLTYQNSDRYYFNAERSNGLKDTDLVTILHPIYVSLVNIVERENPSYFRIVSKALPHMFGNLSNVFLTTPVKDVLFDGMKIDCSASDFSTMAVCSQIKLKVPNINEFVKDIYSFSLLGDKNSTTPDQITIKRGVAKSRDLGTLTAINNETEQKVWNGDECNQFKGTDGWIFPPLSTEETRLWMHSVEFCRNVKADYVQDEVVKGIPVKKYYSDFGDAVNNPEERCYCLSNETCTPSGIYDISPCLKVPLYISLPHFLRADPKLQEKVIGLAPDTESHIIKILFEGTFAVPLDAKIRAQFNIPLKPTEEIELMQTVPELIHPVLWIELGCVLSGPLLGSFQSIFITFKIITVLKYLMLVVSLLGIAYGSFFMVQKRMNRVEIRRIEKNDINLPNKLAQVN